MRVLFVLLASALTLSAAGFARIDSDPETVAKSYGPPVEAPRVSADGSVRMMYEYDGWRITVVYASLHGRSTYATYSRMDHQPIQLTEIQAILEANTAPGQTWTKTIKYSDLFWTRSDGARASVSGSTMSIRLAPSAAAGAAGEPRPVPKF